MRNTAWFLILPLLLSGCAQIEAPAENWKFWTMLLCGLGVFALMVVWGIAHKGDGQKSPPRRRRRFHFHRHG
jgi:hypothetical protein